MKTRKFKLPSLFFITLLLYSPITLSHVQWFVASDEMKYASFSWDNIYTNLTLLVLIPSIFGVFITRHGSNINIIDKIMYTRIGFSKVILASLFSVSTVLFFLLIVVQGGFIAPNLNLPSNQILTGVYLQSLVVLSACISISLSGFFVLVSAFFMMVHIPLAISINYIFEFLSVGIFMLLTGPYLSNLDRQVFTKLNINKAAMWSISIKFLRVGIGCQLAILAYTEKLAYPGLALVFIEMFPFYNFFPAIGLSTVSDLHFVYFIGLCELILGVLLSLGLANRLVMIMLVIAFVTTSFIHGAHEIEGHLPLFGAAFVLICELKNSIKNRSDQSGHWDKIRYSLYDSYVSKNSPARK
ncbi:hypothetical protein [Vibrio paucivorans]